MRRVLHLVGSPTSDFFADLSRLYAADCLTAVADPQRWEFVIAYVSPDGSWRFPDSLATADLQAAPAMSLPHAVERLATLAPDVAVPQLFCLAGMTDYRALLEAIGIPVIGNPAEVMAVGTDKPRTKQLAAAAGIDVPDGVVVSRADLPALDARSVPLPAVVKPVDADNSDGVTLVREAHELASAVAAALEHSAAALVEPYIPLGREVRCGVVERAGGLHVLPLEEYAVDEDTHPVRVGADKLARRDGELTLVAKTGTRAWIVSPDDPVVPAVGRAAERAHRALGCRDYSLFDFRVDPDGRPWLLEAGLYCSFAPSSVIATMAAAEGTGVAELFAAAVEQALARS